LGPPSLQWKQHERYTLLGERNERIVIEVEA
jgi:hypothetical protein